MPDGLLPGESSQRSDTTGTIEEGNMTDTEVHDFGESPFCAEEDLEESASDSDESDWDSLVPDLLDKMSSTVRNVYERIASDAQSALASLILSANDSTAESGGSVRSASRIVRETVATDGSKLGFDEKGRIARTVDQIGRVSLFSYEQDRLSTVTLPNGKTYRSSEGAAWTCSTNEEDKLSGEWKLDERGNCSFHHRDGKRSEYRLDGSSIEFNRDGKATTITYPDGSVRKFEYDQQGKTSSVTHPNGDKWVRTKEYNWTKSGTTQTWWGDIIVKPNGSYDEIGSRYSITHDTNGWMEYYSQGATSYHRRNRDGSWTDLNERGQVVRTIDARGRQRAFEYDASGRLSKVTDAEKTISSSDGLNWVDETTKARTQLNISIFRDGEYRAQSPDGRCIIALPTGGSITADRANRPLEITMANGKKTTMVYNADGDPVQCHLVNGLVLRTSDGGKTWSANENGIQKPYSFSFSRHGDIDCTDLDSGRRTKWFTSGRTLVTDRLNRVTFDESVDGSFTGMTYGESERPLSTRRKLPDGTFYVTTGDTITSITLPGKPAENFVLARNKWNTDGRDLNSSELLRLHQHLGAIYERSGQLPSALASYKAALIEQEKGYLPGTRSATDLATSHERVAALARRLGQTSEAATHSYHAREIRRVSSFLEQLRSSEDAVGDSSIILSRLPQELKIEAEGPRMGLSSNNFRGLLEAIPGLRIPESTIDLKALRFDQNRLRLDGTVTIKAEILGQFVNVNLRESTAELRVDPHDRSKITIANIRGVTFDAGMITLRLTELSVHLIEDSRGNITLRLFPKVEDTMGLGMLTSALISNLTRPIDIPLGSKDETPIGTLFSDVRNWVANDRKCANVLAEKLTGMFVDRELASVLGGLRGLEKRNDELIVRSTGGDLHSLGGLPIIWDNEVRSKLTADGRRIDIKDIRGARIKMPLPGDLAASLGVKNPLEIAITEVTLGPPDRDGNRIAVLKTDGLIEEVSIKVGKDLRPVAVDRAGNVAVNLTLNQGERLPLEILFKPEQAMAGDPKKMDLTIRIKTDDQDKIAKVVERFFGHDLDPVLRNALRGVTSIEKVGDRVTIHRNRASTLSMNGLSATVSERVSFKINSDNNDISISDISGVTIDRLPDAADAIYRRRLPIEIRSLKLSKPDSGGNRTMTIDSSGPMRSATIKLDGSMAAREVAVTVENPVQAMRDRLVAAGLPTLGRRNWGNQLYTISIKDGVVDVGGLSNIASMFSDAGDFVSWDGTIVAGIGYLGTKASNPASPVPVAEVNLVTTAVRSADSVTDGKASLAWLILTLPFR